MAAIVVATPGAANANSYLTVAEAQAYFDTRLPVAGWDDADDSGALVIMATRLIDALLTPARIPLKGEQVGSYLIRSTWTGTPASTTQRLAWPRVGMFDRNGNAIASTIIPQDLKDAVAEYAGALGTKDLTLDNDIAVQGITSVKAGSVSVSFASGIATSKMLPDAVLYLLVPSWMTAEVIEGARKMEFDVV